MLARASGWLGRVFRNASAFFRHAKKKPISKIKEVREIEEEKEFKEYDGVVYFIYEETTRKHNGRKTELEINFKTSLNKALSATDALEEIQKQAINWASEQEGYEWIKKASRKGIINVGTVDEHLTDTKVSDYVLKRIQRETPK